MTLREPQLSTCIVQVFQETELQVDTSFSGKIVLKKPCIGDTGKASAVHVHCSDLQVTWLQAILQGDRALNYSLRRGSFKLFLKEERASSQ